MAIRFLCVVDAVFRDRTITEILTGEQHPPPASVLKYALLFVRTYPARFRKLLHLLFSCRNPLRRG